MSDGSTTPGSDAIAGDGFVGDRVQRREDDHLLRGDARYADDIQPARVGYLALLGSQYAHARIESIDTSAAEAADGVIAVYTHEDLLESGIDGIIPGTDDGAASERPMLARETVRFQGQPVAAVVAEERYAAFSALDLIDVTYDRLETATEIDDALAGDAPAIHDAAPDNVAFEWETGDGEATETAFDAAAQTVRVDLEVNRVIPTALEPRGAVARYRSDDDELILEVASQNPHSVQDRLATILDHPEHRITVRVPDVGGAFGAKLRAYTGHLLATWAAKQLERPIKWQARRGDDFQSMNHGRRQRIALEAALDERGRIEGLRGDVDADVGGYLIGAGTLIPKHTARMLCGQYDVPAAHVSVQCVFTNTAPISAYRGAGRPEAAYAIERLANACARELGIDPAEFRRRNFVPPEKFPIDTAAGRTYDSGEYEKTLDRALEAVDYEAFRERQAELREEGRYLGIGFSCYVEVCGGGTGALEGGLVRMTPGGQVVAHTGTQDAGQGHETTFAQIVADELGVEFDDVEVVEGDTDRVPEGGGTAGSKSLIMGGNALRGASQRLAEKTRRIAAHRLEADPEDVEFADGEFHVVGAPQRAVAIGDVAAAAYDPEAVPEDVEPGLEATTFYSPEGTTAPFGTHATIVEVDPDTGEIDVLEYVGVDDVGTRINPTLVEGQILGGIAQGVGQALYEEGVYDENGNLVTGSLQDYALPKAIHVPEMELEGTVTPTPNNPLGAKGVGEAGTIAAAPAVVNAVLDALEPFGVDHLDMPLTENDVWAAIEGARTGAIEADD